MISSLRYDGGINDVVYQNCNFINDAVLNWQPVKILK